MIKIENTDVYGWTAAIRGMRNPMNSWGKSDSGYRPVVNKPCDDVSIQYVVGKNDLQLMKKLANGGSVHAKYRRMITVTVDITAPLYWWKEFDTYKVGTVANSCSTMHKIHAKEFTMDDFSHEHLTAECRMLLKTIIGCLNAKRTLYIRGNEKHDWWQLIQLLPSSYNQRRTVLLNYEVLTGIYRWRKNHKLDEWRDFCAWIETLPHSELITTGGDNHG